MIVLIVGDASSDGHGQTDSIVVECNLTKTQVEDAFKTGTNKISFKNKDASNTLYPPISNALHLPICNNFKDQQVSPTFLAAIRAAGLTPSKYFNTSTQYQNIDSYTYAVLWLDIAKLGNPRLEYKIITLPTIAIGGYGLF